MILSIDPGLSTGLAARLDNGHWWTDTVVGSEEAFKYVVGLITNLKPNKVVIEHFSTMQYLSKYGIETIELIGAIKGACAVHNVPLYRQTPLTRKPKEQEATAMLKERKQQLGGSIETKVTGTAAIVIKPGYTDHEVSALAHLLMFERRLELAEGTPARPAPMEL